MPMAKMLKASAKSSVSAKPTKKKLSLYPLDMQTALHAALQTGPLKKHSPKKRTAKNSDQ
jgi:hypothetical protein